MQEVRLFVCPRQAGGRAASDLGAVLDPCPDLGRGISRFPNARAICFSPSAGDFAAGAGNFKGGRKQRLDSAYDS